MPYVKASHRKKLDPLVNRVSEELVQSSLLLEKPQQVGQLFFSSFLEIAKFLRGLESRGGSISTSQTGSALAELGKGIFEVGGGDGGFWAGDLNYSLTRIFQIVPRELAARKKWDREFRYWTYAIIAGALERTALAIGGSESSSSPSGAWIDTVLVGVFLDVKDEYKRRVNVPYEEKQIQVNGDCYDVEF